MAASVQGNLELEEFAYTAAHDLREPLRTISVFTSLLLEKHRSDVEAKEIGGFIIDGVARMSALLDDLLSFAVTGKHEPHQPVDLQQAVAHAIQNLAFTVTASGATVTAVDLPIIQGNKIGLVCLFQNLIDNAVKYRSENAVEIQVTAERRRTDWIVKVADNGIGIATENQTRVFMPFVKLADRSVRGTGLGLAVSKRIVEGMGGKIWVESELGAGSAFYFTIAAPGESFGA